GAGGGAKGVVERSRGGRGPGGGCADGGGDPPALPAASGPPQDPRGHAFRAILACHGRRQAGARSCVTSLSPAVVGGLACAPCANWPRRAIASLPLHGGRPMRSLARLMRARLHRRAPSIFAPSTSPIWRRSAS